MLPIVLALAAMPAATPTSFALPLRSTQGDDEGEIDAPADIVCDIVGGRQLCSCPAPVRERSKKGAWLAEKERRPDVHLADADIRSAPSSSRSVTRKGKDKSKAATKDRRGKDIDPLDLPRPRPGARIEPVTTLYNVWTHEALPVLPGDRDGIEERFHKFLRDHYTNQATQMDVRLVGVLVRVAQKYSAQRIEVVSGFRSPKYNLMLRKKGHQVARESQHVEGNAVDFRVRGVPTKTLLGFVRSLRLGGVGFYPRSAFVHSDTGRIRFWTGS